MKESSSWSLSLLLDDDEALELSTSTVGVAVSILFFLLSEPRLTMSRVFTSVEDFGTCFGLGQNQNRLNDFLYKLYFEFSINKYSGVFSQLELNCSSSIRPKKTLQLPKY